jgi:spermidine/putrescine transport system ATP-binding protein
MTRLHLLPQAGFFPMTMSTDTAPPMVELRGVSKRFGGFTAVADVDLRIGAAEFMTFLGPSGCGKTTILRMISGFETPTEGTVHLAGEDVTHLPPYRRNVNQVFQSYALFPHLTVEENIAFGLKMKKTPKSEIADRVQRGVQLVALGGFEKRKPSELSGGQRQRVALARAIVCEPKVLLLDEPLSALDAKLRHQMQIELKNLQRRLGITFIFVTHDQEEALTMSDRIAVINKGRIEQLGDVNAIYHEPRTTFVANFIGEANILPATVVSRGEEQARIRLDGKLEIAIRDANLSAGAKDILVSIRPEKIHIEKQHPKDDSNVFEAVIAEEIFKGATDELTLRHASGLELTACAANESAHEECFCKGDRVWFSLHPRDVVVVQEE